MSFFSFFKKKNKEEIEYTKSTFKEDLELQKTSELPKSNFKEDLNLPKCFEHEMDTLMCDDFQFIYPKYFKVSEVKSELTGEPSLAIYDDWGGPTYKTSIMYIEVDPLSTYDFIEYVKSLVYKCRDLETDKIKNIIINGVLPTQIFIKEYESKCKVITAFLRYNKRQGVRLKIAYNKVFSNDIQVAMDIIESYRPYGREKEELKRNKKEVKENSSETELTENDQKELFDLFELLDGIEERATQLHDLKSTLLKEKISRRYDDMIQQRDSSGGIDYIRLKKDLLNKVGPSGIMGLIVSVDCASNEELLRLAKSWGINVSNYKRG